MTGELVMDFESSRPIASSKGDGGGGDEREAHHIRGDLGRRSSVCSVGK